MDSPEIKESNRNRISKMSRYDSDGKWVCPKCRQETYPFIAKHVVNGYDRSSNLWWCIECLKGEAAAFWFVNKGD